MYSGGVRTRTPHRLSLCVVLVDFNPHTLKISKIEAIFLLTESRGHISSKCSNYDWPRSALNAEEAGGVNFN